MAEGDDDLETLKNITKNFRRALECPICLEVVKQPFKQCARGHLMCVDCLRTLNSCPTCQGALTSENPVCIKQLLEYMPHDCRHSTDGCKKIIEDGNEHEKFCGFRRIKCKSENCAQEVILAKDLLQHVKRNHPNSWIVEQVEARMVWPEFDPEKDDVCSSLVHLFDNFFWISSKNNIENEQLEITFEMIPVRKLDGDYYVNVSFINTGDIGYMYTIKAFIGGQTNDQSSGAERDIKARPDYFCMRVPRIMLPHFYEEQDLKCDLLFFKV